MLYSSITNYNNKCVNRFTSCREKNFTSTGFFTPLNNVITVTKVTENQLCKIIFIHVQWNKHNICNNNIIIYFVVSSLIISKYFTIQREMYGRLTPIITITMATYYLQIKTLISPPPHKHNLRDIKHAVLGKCCQNEHTKYNTNQSWLLSNLGRKTWDISV